MITHNNSVFFPEIQCRQYCKHGQHIFGDVFLSQKVQDENRFVAVLADGLGSGVKANVLATLTASMALNFTIKHKEIKETAATIMKTLPVCSVRKVSYSTFSIIDIDENGLTKIVEYDNPQALIIRDGKEFDPGWKHIEIESNFSAGNILNSCTFQAQKGDRILCWSDGIAQSGMDTNTYPEGWGIQRVKEFVLKEITKNKEVSAGMIAKKVINKALINDANISKDDTSCMSVYFRKPRKMLICTGPPFNKQKDFQFAMEFDKFNGKKIICGGSTSEIIARELNKKIEKTMITTDKELPPISKIEGIDLVSEGVLTLEKVIRILEKYDENYNLSNGPADEIVKAILHNDEVKIIAGLGVNLDYYNPELPIEVEIRKNLIKKLITLLEINFLKDVNVVYY